MFLLKTNGIYFCGLTIFSDFFGSGAKINSANISSFKVVKIDVFYEKEAEHSNLGVFRREFDIEPARKRGGQTRNIHFRQMFQSESRFSLICNFL